jgi:hypothetical protein
MEKDRPIRSQPPRLDEQEVIRLLAELEKISTSVNEIARHINGTNPPNHIEDALKLALHDLADLRICCLRAIGHEPHPNED